ncbi:MAG: hypothetical protein JST16_10770 [Bdellovibrionales bacterium]|nr:hypothetical protein [Bdellovibrionales bacterium]
MSDLKRRIEDLYQESPWLGLAVSLGAGVGLGAFGVWPVLARAVAKGAQLTAVKALLPREADALAVGLAEASVASVLTAMVSTFSLSSSDSRSDRKMSARIRGNSRSG